MLHFAPARRMRAAVGAVLAFVGAIGVPAAHADGPGVGTLNVVAVGDSYISGPDGRSNVTAKTTAIKNAILNVNTAMTHAGYSNSQFTLLVQTYPSPVPNGAG